jgi:hypothetical protein
MCYTPEMSFSFALLGIIALLYINHTKHKFIAFIILFYVLMELLQTVQAYLVNDCKNPWNIFLTEVAYIFVILQPVIWNIYFYLTSTPMEKGLFKAGIGLSIGWLVFNVLGRLMYGRYESQTRTDSLFANDKVCTLKGASHLYWTWTTANLGDLNATFIMHLLIWFIPALLSSTHFFTAIILILGAAVSAAITIYMGDIRGVTAAWCYISVPLLAIIFAKDILEK